MPIKDWKDDFRYKLEDFVDRCVVIGAERNEVLNMIAVELEALRTEFEQDPDPAQEESRRDPEPANDWPGAERD